jgi:hypothetical protein
VSCDEHGIRPHGGLERRVLAVLLHEQAGGAVGVEVGGHEPLERPSTARSQLPQPIPDPRGGQPKSDADNVGNNIAKTRVPTGNGGLNYL